jgi:hypothetical protein
MKVVFHEDFYQVYTTDPASAPGRMEAVVEELGDDVEFVAAVPATESDIALAHDAGHIESVRREGLYPISALAAGGAIQVPPSVLMNPASDLFGHPAIMRPPDRPGVFVILTTWPLP